MTITQQTFTVNGVKLDGDEFDTLVKLRDSLTECYFETIERTDGGFVNVTYRGARGELHYHLDASPIFKLGHVTPAQDEDAEAARQDEYIARYERGI